VDVMEDHGFNRVLPGLIRPKLTWSVNRQMGEFRNAHSDDLPKN
jgi:hypothetical protein